MKYIVKQDKIIVYSKEEFCPEHILECGQIFSYEKINNNYVVYSADKMAKVIEKDDCYEIVTNNIKYFVNFFDLDADYSNIKKELINNHSFMQNVVDYGYGIRILKQDLFETIISFIVSANNNIKRIKKILFNIREKFGDKKDGYYAFPTAKQLLKATEDDFKSMGAGYRAKYLAEATKQLSQMDLNALKNLSTDELNKVLLSLMGVGQKVADCIMLFGFSKQDVFPVDTWIEKVYCTYFKEEHNRLKIRKELVNTFGNLSGYAQQYLFYSQREKS